MTTATGMTLEIRKLRDAEYAALGRLMVEAYSKLDGFPGPDEQPRYYAMLADIGRFNERPETQVLAAFNAEGELVGGVVHFGDMAQYGSGGTATQVKNASGIRLLAVDPKFRGSGAGRALTDACIGMARERGHDEVVLHTTRAMHAAWAMYERIGFRRSPDLDFMQDKLPVFGFRLALR